MYLTSKIFSEPNIIDKESAWLEHIPMAIQLIDLIRPKVFVELGTHYGISYFNFCQAIIDSGLSTKAFAVDSWTGDQHSGFYNDEVYNFVKEINDKNYSSFSTLHKMSFDEALKEFNDNSIDLIHIDGFHTYEAVKHDFESWLPKMSDQGVIVLHDTAVKENNFGVWKLLEELKLKYNYLEFEHGYGLAIICVGTKVNKFLLNFIDKSKKDSFTHLLFKHLGEHILKKRQLKKLSNKISDYENTISTLNENIKKIRSQNVLEQKNKDSSILELSKIITDQENSINNLNRENKELKIQLSLKTMIVSKITNSKSWKLTGLFRGLKNNWFANKYRLYIGIKLIRNSNQFKEDFYINNNPDVKNYKGTPLEHYILYGGFEGRNPSEYFDSSFYNTQYPDIFVSRINPLLHYLKYGIKENRKFNPNSTQDLIGYFKNNNSTLINNPFREIINKLKYSKQLNLVKNSGLFNEEYYLGKYEDVKNSEQSPINHFFNNGWKEGKNPNCEFDTEFYLNTYSDVKNEGINPLLHYIKYGKKENRFINHKISSTEEKGNQFEEADETEFELDKIPIKTIVFYLPQFHPIPENDKWWGEGFTEWTNVKKAKPLFEGHYQPREPLSLGYYDLRDSKIMEKQIHLAKTFGIKAFCFYYYWFNGKRLLEKPLDQFLEHPEWEIEFCLCWANENWTRKWDGMDDQVLMSQEHTEEDDLNFIKDIDKYINDKRYVKINGKPLLIIYRPQLFPDIKRSVNIWRQYYRENFGGELFVCMVQSFGGINPKEFNIDGAVEFPPHNIKPTNITASFKLSNFYGNIFDTRSVTQNRKNIINKSNFEVFRGLMLNWDNTPRRGKNGNIFLNNTPKNYQNWFKDAIIDTNTNKTDKDLKLVFINAWNEWAEGTHLEPDKKYGYSYLNATKKSLLSLTNNQRIMTSTNTILFISHDACLGGAQKVLLDTISWIYKHTTYNIKILFIRGGELLNEFAAFGEIHIMQENENVDYYQVLSGIIDLETKLIYVNSVASSKILKAIKLFNIPILLHVHELQKSIQIYAKGHIEDLFKYPDHFIACSSSVHKNLEFNGVNETNISLVHAYVQNNVKIPISKIEKREVRKKLGLPIEKKLVFGVGLGLFWRKGADVFIEVCNNVINKLHFSNIHFIWIGEFSTDQNSKEYGNWQDHYKKIDEYNIQNYISFIGKKINIREYLSCGDIFLLPSREDPFPLVCLEAADNYLPIICFEKAGGIPELVGDDAGIVVPYLDIDQMSNAIIKLLKNEAYLIAKGLIAHNRFVESFSVKASMKKILETIKKTSNTKPLVSVIVPNYNYSNYLEQRLKSIYNQSFQDFEVIILDDNSTDDSINIINKYRNKPSTSVILNEINGGSVFKQWEKGVKQAIGEYIWIAEADDYSDINFLHKLLPVFHDNEITLAYCNSHVVDEEGNIQKFFYNKCGYYQGLKYPSRKWDSDYTNIGQDEITNVLAVKNSIPNCSAVIFKRTSFLMSELEIIENLNCSHDWLTYINIIKNGKLFYSAEPLNFHRRHKKSVIALSVNDYKTTITEYFKSHSYILQNFDVSTNTIEKMKHLVLHDLSSIWPEIGIDKILEIYTIPDNPFKYSSQGFSYKQIGYCPICEMETVFHSRYDWYRDHYKCMDCHSIPRERAILKVLNDNFPHWKNEIVHEFSPSNNNISKKITNHTHSQYFEGNSLGIQINGVRNENIENLSFESSTIDFLISLDVLEHVFNPDKAFQQMTRCMTNDGAIVFTVPIYKKLEKSRVRARQKEDKSIEHLLPEEYHGNPVGDGKALVTWDYGKDFKLLLQQWVGEKYDVEIVSEKEPKYGIIGEFIDVVIIKHKIEQLSKFSHLTNEQWHNKILKSLETNKIDELEVGFPSEQTQFNLTGRKNERALFQAFNFYKRVMHYAGKYINKENDQIKICDFACGWGRITRYFIKDIKMSNITAMDCVEDYINICKVSIPGINFELIPNMPPYNSRSRFDLICAYSLFSHLSMKSALEILKEMHKMLKPNGLIVITSRGTQFIEYCEQLRLKEENESDSQYRNSLRGFFKPKIESLSKYNKGEYQFYNYGGKGILDNDLYGEAAIPKEWFTNRLNGLYDVVGFETENMQQDLDQTIIVLKKT